jgi:hypothetical protein
MLWLAFVTKALHSDKEAERAAVLRIISTFELAHSRSRLQPLDLSRNLELEVCKNYLILLYTRIGKLLTSTSLILRIKSDFDVTHYLLLLYAANATPQGKIAMPGLWAQIGRESERLVRQAGAVAEDTTDDKGDAEVTIGKRIVAMIGHLVEVVLRDESKGNLGDWQMTKEWEHLMDMWLGLYRAVSFYKISIESRRGLITANIVAWRP